MAARKPTTSNLKRLTPTEARINGRKGGIASVKKRRQIKNTKAFFNIIKDCLLPNEMNEKLNKFFGTDDKEYTFATLNLFNILRASCDGNANAMKLINDLDGSMEKEKPDEKVSPNVYVVSSIEAAQHFTHAEEYGIAQAPTPPEDDEDDDE